MLIIIFNLYNNNNNNNNVKFNYNWSDDDRSDEREKPGADDVDVIFSVVLHILHTL